jgi:hypothetical protein
MTAKLLFRVQLAAQRITQKENPRFGRGFFSLLCKNET